MSNQVSLHSSRNRRERRWVGLGGLASGLMLVVSGLHGVAPVAAQTVSVPSIQVEDRGFGIDNHGLGDVRLDIGQEDRQLEVGDDRLTVEVEQQVELGDVPQEDRATEIGNVRQEDRQEDRAMEVDDDRLVPQAEVGDVRQEDRQQDRAAEIGDDRLTRPVEQQAEHATVSTDSGRSAGVSDDASKTSSGSGSNSVVSTASTSSATSSTKSGGGSTSGSGGHGGHDDGGAHH
jgi:hypothetical protein